MARASSAGSQHLHEVDLLREIHPYLPRIVKQLFIRECALWTGEEARRITGLGLHGFGTRVPPVEFRLLMSAVYRLGKVFEPTPQIHSAVPWDWNPLRDGLTKCAQDCLDTTTIDALFQDLSAICGGTQFNSLKVVDWVEVFNRAARRTGCDDVAISLESKLALAEHIQFTLAARLDSLVEYAEEMQGMLFADAVNVLEELITERSAALTRVSNPVRQSIFHRERLSEDAMAATAMIVHESERRAFQDWMKCLTRCTQIAIHRRLTALTADPIASRIWTKMIVGHKGALRELKVVSENTHYRILFTPTIGNAAIVLSFGLRRDLNDLIERAGKLLDHQTRARRS